MAAFTLLASGAATAQQWHTFWNGAYSPECVGTADGPWAWYCRFDDRNSELGKECFWEILDGVAGSNGKVIHVSDTTGEWDASGLTGYVKWNTIANDPDRENPPCGTWAIQNNYPGCTGGTIVLKFKINSYAPRTSESDEKTFMVMGWQFTDNVTNPSQPRQAAAKIDIKADAKGNLADEWHLKNVRPGYRWDQSNNQWVDISWRWLRGGDYKGVGPDDNTNGIIKDWCDGNWHTLWIRIDPDYPAAPYPALPLDAAADVCRHRIWIDGKLKDEWWGIGQTYASGSILAETGRDEIDLYVDHFGFSYSAADPNGIAIPADTVTWSGNSIGDARKAADGTYVGTEAAGRITGKYVTGKWDLPSVKDDERILMQSGTNFDEVLFVSEDDRSAGMIVETGCKRTLDESGNWTSISTGDRVDIYGAVMSPMCDKWISSWKVVKVDPGTTPAAVEPVTMTGKTIEQAWNAKGADCFGLYVGITGKVTYVDNNRDYCYIDDGSGYVSGAFDVTYNPPIPVKGVKVWYGSANMPDGAPYKNDDITAYGCLGASRYTCNAMGIDPVKTAMPSIWAKQLFLSIK